MLVGIGVTFRGGRQAVRQALGQALTQASKQQTKMGGGMILWDLVPVMGRYTTFMIFD